jgi:hypothetical protein
MFLSEAQQEIRFNFEDKSYNIPYKFDFVDTNRDQESYMPSMYLKYQDDDNISCKNSYNESSTAEINNDRNEF